MSINYYLGASDIGLPPPGKVYPLNDYKVDFFKESGELVGTRTSEDGSLPSGLGGIVRIWPGGSPLPELGNSAYLWDISDTLTSPEDDILAGLNFGLNFLFDTDEDVLPIEPPTVFLPSQISLKTSGLPTNPLPELSGQLGVKNASIKKAPEPGYTISLLALCTLGAASTFKRKLKSSKFPEKEL